MNKPNSQQRIKIVGWALRGFHLPNAQFHLLIEDVVGRWCDAYQMIEHYPDLTSELEVKSS